MIYSDLLKIPENQKFDFELIEIDRRKGKNWKEIHCFEDITAGEDQDKDYLAADGFFIFSVLFIISLSDYNQTLEDGTTNRMQESEREFG